MDWNTIIFCHCSILYLNSTNLSLSALLNAATIWALAYDLARSSLRLVVIRLKVVAKALESATGWTVSHGLMMLLQGLVFGELKVGALYAVSCDIQIRTTGSTYFFLARSRLSSLQLLSVM